MDNSIYTPNQQPLNQSPTPPPVPTPTPSPQPEPPKKKGSPLKIVLAVLLAGAGGFALAYFWQQAAVSSKQQNIDTLSTENAQLEQQLATHDEAQPTDDSDAGETAPSASTNTELIPGDAVTNRDDGIVTVEAIYKMSLAPTAVWVEYGTSPTEFSQTTEKITSELAMGDEEYSLGRIFNIDSSKLKTGTRYYYRTAATINGATQYSTPAAFTTTK